MSPGPGLTQFTRIPNPARSTAITCESATIPALATQYAAHPFSAPSASTEAVNAIEPPVPASFIASATRRASAKWLVRLTSISRCHASSVVSRNGTSHDISAWFEISTSIPPAVATVVSTTAAAEDGSHRSTAIGIASAPSFVTSAVTRSRRSGMSSTRATCEAPSRASPIAVAIPNPAPAPVTSARLPANRCVSTRVPPLTTVRIASEP